MEAQDTPMGTNHLPYRKSTVVNFGSLVNENLDNREQIPIEIEDPINKY